MCFYWCSTHRPADEEHRDGSYQWHVSDQRFKDHAQLPIQLQRQHIIWKGRSQAAPPRLII